MISTIDDILDDFEDEDDDEEALIQGVLCEHHLPIYSQYQRAHANYAPGLAVAGELQMRQQQAERCLPSRAYLTRPDLPLPRSDTSWQHMLTAGNDRAFITTMGFDVASFQYILDARFQECWNTTAIERRDVNVNGVPRISRCSLDAAGGLGLVLHYIHSCMMQTSLQQIFGLVPATVDRHINFALNILDVTLAKMPEARILWPDEVKMKEYEHMITARHPLLQGAFGSIDGLNLPIEVPNDPDMENATYNAWTHGHYSSQMFFFGPDGMSNYSLWKCN
jgi:hypothetical protein